MNVIFYVLAFLLSVLTGIGVGSGGILTVFSLEWMKLSPETSVLCNLLLFAASFCCAAVFHIKGKRICYGFLLPVLLLGVPGSYLGHIVMELLPAKWLKAILGILTVI
ncbi:MAG: TSUP family transporter [Clostridia bacterium]|nr:TSUP family transporter [Clostridia bacterium]